jgi:hypothetical protein
LSWKLIYFIFILSLISIFIVLSLSERKVFSQSPPFIRKIINDHEYFPDSDSILFINNEVKDISSNNINLTKIQHIKEVSVFSNGKIINSTISLIGNSEIESSVKELRYEMLIDVLSDFETDFPRNDYIISIIWQNNTWTRQLGEILDYKSIGNLSIKGNSILEVKENYTNFYDKENNAIRLFLDLGKINYPEKYKLMFRATTTYENGSSLYKISDYTQPIQIPIQDILSFFMSHSTDISNSNSFSPQQIIDRFKDWKDLFARNYTIHGEPFTDLASIDYFSNGDRLNAILWTYSPFKTNISSSNRDINYGMYIDADFNDKTGFGGIDYKFEINWNNKTKEWTKTLEKWSQEGNIIVLEKELISFTDFTNEGAYYILLSANLEAMLSPKKYKVLFYAESRKEESFITDFSNWIAAPHPEIAILPSENFITIHPGETKTITININSTIGFTPYIEFQTQKSPLSVDIKPSSLNILAHGKATTSVTITALDKKYDASKYSIPVLIKGSFIFPSINKSALPSEFSFIPSDIISEDISKTFFLDVEVQEPYTLNDHINQAREEFNKIWDYNRDIVIVIIGIFLTPFGAWIFDKMIKRRKQRKKINSNK